MKTAAKPLVLLVDDDPSHLKLYSWIIERGGYSAHPVLATGAVDKLPIVPSDVSVLDYRLGPIKSVDVAHRILRESPGNPVIILSDSIWMPEEFRGVTTVFVRKGDPQQLLDSITAELTKSK